MSTPRQLGYSMPAEWEKHSATWLSWPHNPETWPGKMEPIPGVWAHIVKTLSQHERVQINVNDETMRSEVSALLVKHGVDLATVQFHLFPTNDCWVRDHGPIFLRHKISGELALTNWQFNMWGGKYPPWDKDNQIPDLIAEAFNYKKFDIDFVLEGGSIEVNGVGSLLTTRSCLLNKNRNPNYSEREIENILKENLGVEQILWLEDGIIGDDTDGHIDDLARFTDTQTIVTVVEDYPTDANYPILQNNLSLLKKMRNLSGQPFRIETLPMPKPVFYEDRQLPASYANFYIANKVVLVPIFDDPNDATALDKLAQLFPERRIIGIPSRDLVWGLGALHCITQQQPQA